MLYESIGERGNCMCFSRVFLMEVKFQKRIFSGLLFSYYFGEKIKH
nr:MAG TPA: hypothetical protein [Caudoviricetes sp.]